jgi:hypothetical protein
VIEVTEKTLKSAINEVAASDAGRIVLAALKAQCKWDDTFVASGDPVQTHYFAAMRGVYGGLRRHIRKDHLKAIEFDYVLTKESGKNDDGADDIKRRSDRKPTGIRRLDRK